MKLFLTNKIALKLTGNVDHFLTGMSSNTLDALHNAFLNQHGRIVATFEQLRLSEDAFLILIEQSVYDNFLEHIDKYLKLNQTQCEKLPAHVYCDLTGDALLDGTIIGQGAGRYIVTDQEQLLNVSNEEFAQFRLEHQLPLQGIDYQDQMVLNVDDQFVSFTKGCFLGQEPVSKVYNRAEPTWKLVVANKDDLSTEDKDKMTSIIKDDQGNIRGFVFIKNKGENK